MWEGTLIIRCCAMVMLYTSTLTVDPVLAGTGIEVLQQWQAEQENENQESDSFDTHGDHFGCALALDGNFAIVGAQFNHAYRYGGAYSFWNMSNQTWTRDSMLTVNQCVNNLTDCGDDGYRMESYQGLGNAVDIFKVSETEAWALVGATGFDNDDNGTGVVDWYSGQVFLMQLHSGDWTLKEIYKPWDGPAANNKYSHDNFGASVSLTKSGGTFFSLIGATRAEAVPLSHPNTNPKYPFPGRAYLHSYSDLGAHPKFELSPPEDDDGEDHYLNSHFGKSVSIDGTKAIVGADWAWDYQGRAYIYDCENVDWDCFGPNKIEPIELPPPGSVLSGNDYYGTSVAISSTGIDHGTAAVGSPGSNNYSGRAFAYVRSELPNGNIVWKETELIPSLPGGNLERRDRFGTSVSVSDDGKVIAVGAVGRNEARGMVYVFKRLPDNSGDDTWQHVLVVEAGNGRRYDLFGNAISLSGSIDDCRLLVGAYLYDETGKSNNNGGVPGIPGNDLYLNAGCTYLFEISDDPSPPTGACCIDLFCMERTQADCQGVYFGDGTNCNDDPCDTSEPSGACDSDCKCIETTQFNCEASGSMYLGDDTNCADDIGCSRADLILDGVVDVQDLLLAIADWNCESDCSGDTDCDGMTTVADLLNVLGNWGCSY